MIKTMTKEELKEYRHNAYLKRREKDLAYIQENTTKSEKT